MNEQSTLEALNDDCLHHIFTFLLIEDVVRMCLASYRFRVHAERWMSMHEIQFKRHAQIFKHMVPAHFFASFGNCIKRMYVCAAFEYADLLAEYVNRVEFMMLGFLHDDIGQVSFIGRMQSLRELHIESFLINPDMSLIGEVIKLQHLECLRIKQITRFTGERLNELHRLKELDLSACRDITAEHFIQAFLANPNLTRINIRFCRQIGPQAYRRMAQDSRRIESLEFHASTLLGGEFIPGLNHLDHLAIHFEAMNSTSAGLILSGYLETNCATLKWLKCTDCRKFTVPESLRFPNLTELIVIQYDSLDLDVLLKTFCRSFPRLERIFLRCWSSEVTQDAVLHFFRQSKNLVCANLPIGGCFDLRLYKEIVCARRTLNNTARLKLGVNSIVRSTGYHELVAFMEGDDYATYRQLVELSLSRL